MINSLLASPIFLNFKNFIIFNSYIFDFHYSRFKFYGLKKRFFKLIFDTCKKKKFKVLKKVNYRIKK